MSYNGQMNFGLLGDFDALPDIDAIGESIDEELATLVALARECRLPRPELGSAVADDVMALCRLLRDMPTVLTLPEKFVATEVIYASGSTTDSSDDCRGTKTRGDQCGVSASCEDPGRRDRGEHQADRLDDG